MEDETNMGEHLDGGPVLEMTVGELIARLETFPQDAPVMVDGYEWGILPPWPPRLVSMKRGANGASYGGRHDEDADGDEEVVLISRNKRG